MTVNPNFRPVVYSVELNCDRFTALIRVEQKMLAIPADAAGRIASAAGKAGTERTIAAPVVGKVQAPPGVVIEGRNHCRRELAPLKEPIGVEIFGDTRGGQMKRQTCTKTGQKHQKKPHILARMIYG